MPAAEFAEWQGYWMLEPWGATREDMHASRIEALLYNVNRAKDAPVKSWPEFMYRDKWQAMEDQKAEFAKSVLGFIRRNNEAIKNG
jgi:hypothetical protein